MNQIRGYATNAPKIWIVDDNIYDMIIETYTHQKPAQPLPYNTGNGAPEQGFNPPRAYGVTREIKKTQMRLTGQAAHKWVMGRVLEPHNSRRHIIIKRPYLIELERLAIAAQVLGSNPFELSDSDVGNILTGVKKLLKTGNNSFRVI